MQGCSRNLAEYDDYPSHSFKPSKLTQRINSTSSKALKRKILSLSLWFYQHQCVFQLISSLHQVAKVLDFPASALDLPLNIQD